MGGIYDLKQAFREVAPNIDLRGVTMRYTRDPETGKDVETYEFRYFDNGEERVAEATLGPQERPLEGTIRAAEIARGVADRIVCRREGIPSQSEPAAPAETPAQLVGLSVPEVPEGSEEVFDADKVSFKSVTDTPFLSRVMAPSKTTKKET